MAALLDTNATSRSNRTFVDVDLDAKPVHFPAHLIHVDGSPLDAVGQTGS